MRIENNFQIKQTVYLKTDADQLPRIITGIIVRPNDLVYELTCGTVVSNHFDFEITTEQDILTRSQN